MSKKKRSHKHRRPAILARVLSGFFQSLHTCVHWWWLALVGPVLIALCFVVPPFQTADEPNHFLRAVQVADGSWLGRVTPDGRVVAECPAAALALADHPLYSGLRTARGELAAVRAAGAPDPAALVWTDQRVEVSNHNTLLYPPTAYMVPAAAILAGRTVGLGVLACHRLARLATCCTCLFFGFLALAITPRGRWPLMIILSFPLVLQLQSSVSMDGVLITATALAVALLADLCSEQPNAGSEGAWIVMLLVTYIALCKPTYVVLPFLAVWMLLRSRFRYTMPATVGLAGSLLAIGVWLALIRPLAAVPVHEGANPGAQLAVVISDPVTFLARVVSDFSLQHWFYRESASSYLCWLDVPMPRWTIVCLDLFLLIWVVASIVPALSMRRAREDLAIVLLCMLGGVLLIYLSIYLSWSEVGSPVIGGIQGRYFIPLLLAVCLACEDKPRLGPNPGIWKLRLAVFPLLTVAFLITQQFVMLRLLAWRFL